MTNSEQVAYWLAQIADNRAIADHVRSYLGIDPSATVRLNALDAEYVYFTRQLNAQPMSATAGDK